jgi:hypothetical protein
MIWHLAGGLLAGSAVARTVVDLVRVTPGLVAPSLAARHPTVLTRQAAISDSVGQAIISS